MTAIEGTLRRATSYDLEAVVALDRASPVGTERSELLVSRVRMSEVILFERDKRVVGYVVHRPHAFFGRDFVELITVETECRRMGIASLLLRYAVELSSTQRIFTSTNRSNYPMIRLLGKAGWQYSGQLDGIDDGDPEVVYYKDSLSSEHKMTFVNPENLA